jgi:hypothetical protein
MQSQLFATAIVRSLALTLLAATPLISQTQTAVVEWSRHPIGSNKESVAPGLRLSRQIEGVEIEEILVGGQPITVGEPFSADDDWLKTLSLRVRNVSNQRLVAIQLTVVLPEMSNASPDVVYCYGCAAAEKQKGMMPGEEAELKILGGGFYDWVKGRSVEKGISRITKAEIHHMYATLPDGAQWFSGCIKTANPKNACPAGSP